MKLTKQKLNKLISQDIVNLGYKEFKDSTTGAHGLYVKAIENTDLFITLGMIIHRYYDFAFTFAFYFSKTTRWSSLWGDIPKASYVRPGCLLGADELNQFFKDERNPANNKDLWWNEYNDKIKQDIIKIINITEMRLVNNFELRNLINSSTEVRLLRQLSDDTIRVFKERNLNSVFDFQPNKPIDNTPLEWFKAAEIALLLNKEDLNSNTVKQLGTDAYRQFSINSYNISSYS